MGTHPIFESDFDCLTGCLEIIGYKMRSIWILVQIGFMRADSCFDEECEFELVLRHKYTMSCKASNGAWYPVTTDGTPDDVKINHGESNFYIEEKAEILAGMNLTFSPEDCIFGDGVKTSVISINDQFPGPAIEVRQGATVHITVRNMMYSTSATVHWHGFELRGGYFWYDGAYGITQCGIGPGNSFTYSFVADEVGTRWYHGHARAMRVDGLYGAFIVHPRDAQPTRPAKIIQIADILHQKIHKGGAEAWISSSIYLGGTGETNTAHEYNRLYYPNGVETSGNAMDNILMNGRSQFDASTPIPREMFSVQKGEMFHIIGATSDFSILITIAEHAMEIVEVDGFAVEPFTVAEFVLNPGETVALRPLLTGDGSSGPFEILAREGGITAGIDQWEKSHEPRKATALLRYTSDTVVDSNEATADPEYSQANAIWASMADGEAILRQDELFGLGTPLPNGYFPSENDESQPNFVRLGMNVNFYSGPSFNGFKFKFPVEPYSSNGSPTEVQCPKHCPNRFNPQCHCTQSFNIAHGSIVEIMMTSYVDSKFDRASHPIHIHGNSFFVVAQGDGIYHNKSYIEDNPHFTCDDAKAPNCAETKQLQDVDYNFENPRQRTSVMVPVNGYAVIRFKADNPGVWMMHCHMASHNLEGQVVLLKVTDKGVPKVPDGFPTCARHVKQKITDDLVTLEDIGKAPTQEECSTQPPHSAAQSVNTSKLAIAVLFATVVLAELVSFSNHY